MVLSGNGWWGRGGLPSWRSRAGRLGVFNNRGCSLDLIYEEADFDAPAVTDIPHAHSLAECVAATGLHNPPRA